MTEYDCLLHNMIFPGQQQFCWVGWADGNQGSRWHQPGNLPAAEVREFMHRELYTTHNHTSGISLVTYFALFAFCSFKLFSDFWCIVRNAYWRQKSGTKRKPCVRENSEVQVRLVCALSPLVTEPNKYMEMKHWFEFIILCEKKESMKHEMHSMKCSHCSFPHI